MKTHKIIIHIGLVALLTGFITACKVTKPYSRPQVAATNSYRDGQAGDTTTIANLSWRVMFTDTVLQKLIAEGLEHNLDLKIAVASMEQSAATFKQSKAAFLPSLSVDADVTEAKLSGIQGYNTVSSYRQYQLEASTSWEADIWGKLKSSKKAAYATLLASDAYRRAVLTQLIADIANNYYTLMAYDKQLAITEQTLKNRTEDVKTMEKLKDGDVVTGADVVQSVANKFAASVTIPDLKLNIRQTENALCLLLGREPGTIERLTLTDQHTVEQLATGVPAQLLANRPDVQQAEYTLMSAFENTNIARTAFYPALTLTATGGLSSTALNKFFNASSLFGNIVAGVTQPIFNKGANKAQLRIAQAEQQSALFSFQKSLLTGGQEVSNAMFSYQMALQKTIDRTEQIKALEKAVNYTKQLLKYTSATNYTDVLTAEQNLLSAQLSGVSDRLQQLQGVVNLYRALGGGWK
jgi:multidrug efflux system outer membrane protein